MDEYISREAVLQKFLERGSGYINELTMRDMINEIPAADVQTVKLGRWIKDEKGTFHHCSECGGETFRDVDSWGLEYEEYCTDYCPHCGARMIKDGDTNERS